MAPWRSGIADRESGVHTTGVRRKTPSGQEPLAGHATMNAARFPRVPEWRSTRLLLRGVAPLA